jgi:hypothetical protein
LEEINSVFGPDHVKHINAIVESWDPEWYAVQSNSIRLNNPGKILSDRLASQLFLSKNVEF